MKRLLFCSSSHTIQRRQSFRHQARIEQIEKGVSKSVTTPFETVKVSLRRSRNQDPLQNAQVQGLAAFTAISLDALDPDRRLAGNRALVFADAATDAKPVVDLGLRDGHRRVPNRYRHGFKGDRFVGQRALLLAHAALFALGRRQASRSVDHRYAELLVLLRRK